MSCIKSPIGIFDSGIGGVTVLIQLLKILKTENYIYYSDSKNNPYGDKDENEIIEIADNIVKKLIDQDCKMIIIACNTASAIAAEYLRKKYSKIPILAIEPACKMIKDYTDGTNTLILATKATLNSKKFNKLARLYLCNDTEFLSCIGLADIIEEGNKLKIDKYLNDNLTKYKGKIKNVVLGCTHYPLIKDEITKILGNVNFFDGAEGVAKNAKNILKQNGILSNNKKGEILFLDSNKSDSKRKRFFDIINKIL